MHLEIWRRLSAFHLFSSFLPRMESLMRMKEITKLNRIKLKLTQNLNEMK